MTSPTPGPSSRKLRHRIIRIKLEPSTAARAISLKVLVDTQEALRLPAIPPNTPLSWNDVLSRDIDSSSRVEIRVYEKQSWIREPRVGSLSYTVSEVSNLSEASMKFDTNRFKAVLSFPTPEAAKEAPAIALAKAQAMEHKIRPLERLGPTRAVLKAILDGGEILSELHPVASIVVGFCKIAWQTLEKQEECDASVEKLVVDLARMLPFVDQIEKAARLPQLQNTVEAMKNLVEDASTFVVKYKLDDGPIQGLRAVVGSEAQDQVQDLLGKFKDLKEDFDRGMGVQTSEAMGAVNDKVDTANAKIDVLITDVQRALLNDLKPVGSALYDSTRACLSETRTRVIQEIADWCKQDTSERLLWVYGQAGLGKSSIATSVCQRLENGGNPAIEFFCKRDDSKRSDPQQLLTTVIYGLAHRHSGYAKSVADAIQADSRLCSSPVQKQYDNLIKDPLKIPTLVPPATNLVMVVDALDECGTVESRRQLLAFLDQMSRLVPWLKVIVTSRPDPDITSFFSRFATAGVSRKNLYDYSASEDIRLFIQERMLSSNQSTYLPPDVTDVLTKRAAGLFIWAKTACELILNNYDPKSAYDLVVGNSDTSESTNPLDTLYTTVIETSVRARGVKGVQHVQACLGAIVVCSTRTPLSIAGLSDLLGGELQANVLQSVVDSLGSVLYTDHAKGGAVRVYHQSFTDYITSTAPADLRVDLERRNTDFARCCLRTMIAGLRFNICGLETSHIPNSQVSDLSSRVDRAISLPLSYSCRYWTSHLMESKKEELERLLRDFLVQPTVLYWIEVLSLLGKVDVAMFNAIELSNWCQGREELFQWASDTYRFILSYYDAIATSTPHLYVSALAFCPMRTVYARHLRATFRNTMTVTRGADMSWSPWLRCISHPGKVYAVALSKDSRRVVSGGSDGSVRVWDANTGEALGNPLVGHSKAVNSVGFSPDGRRIVSGSDDMTVQVWDADTGAPIGDPLVGHSGYIRSVSFSPDGRRIVSGSNDKTVRVWDAETGTAIGDPLVGHLGTVRSVGFSPDGRRIVSGSDDMTVRFWDADTSTALGNPLVGHSDRVMSVGFSPDGRRIVSGSYDNTMQLWDADNGAAIGNPLVGHSSSVWSVGFSPDGRRIVSGSYDKTVRLWDADTGAVIGDPLVGHSGTVWSVGFSPDGRRIVSGSQDRTVRVWDADTGAAISNPLVGHSDRVMSVGFSSDGCRIISGLCDKTARLWDADTGAVIGDPLIGHSGTVWSVGFSPDGRRIVSGSDDMAVRLWDADTFAPIGDPLVGHSKAVNSVSFSPDGRRIVSGSDDMTVQVWDADTGAPIGDPLVGHSGYIRSVSFSPDGCRIVSGSDDNTVRVWNADTGAPIGDPLVGHSDRVMSVGFSPDGLRIVSGSYDNTVRVWDADTFAAIGDPLVGHLKAVNSVGFSPDSRRIVSGSDDSTVQVWDADTGAAIGDPLVGHLGTVRSVGFSPDGCRIVSGSDDMTVRLWDSNPTHSVSLPCSTSRLSHRLSIDGWVCDEFTNALLFWLPPEYRRQDPDDSLFVISADPTLRQPVILDYSQFLHGTEWRSVYTP